MLLLLICKKHFVKNEELIYITIESQQLHAEGEGEGLTDRRKLYVSENNKLVYSLEEGEEESEKEYESVE